MHPSLLRWLPPATAALGLVPLACALLGFASISLAVALGVGASSVVHSGLFIRLAWHVHTATRFGGLCRSTGFTGLATLAAGCTTVTAVLLGARSTGGVFSGAPTAAGLAAAGLLLATLLYLLGLLLLPGVVATGLARLRRLLDGAGLGSCFGYTAWLLVGPRSGARALTIGVALVCCTGLAIAVITALGAVRHRISAIVTAGGAALTMIGLAGVAIALETGASSSRLLAAAVPLVIAPSVSLVGAGRCALTDQPADWPGADEEAVGYPILAVPVGAALAASVYNLASGRNYDPASIVLGMVAAGSLTARQMFAALDLRRFVRGVARREAQFRSLLAGSPDLTILLGEDGHVRWQSPAAARRFGLSDQEVVDRPFLALVHPEDTVAVLERLAALPAGGGSAVSPVDGPPAPLSIRLRDGFGRWHYTESTIHDQRAVPEVSALIVHVREVEARSALPDPATTTTHLPSGLDELTGLADRRQLVRTMAGMRAVPGQPGALLLIELDEVAAVDEVHGSGAADAVLVEVGHRLRETVGVTDLAARLSEEVFAIATARPPVGAFALAVQVRDALAEPFDLPGTVVRLAANVGLAELAGAASVGDALSRAEEALRRASQLRSGGIEWYDEVLAAAQQRRRILERELPGAVDRGELDLLYQPVLDLSGRTPVGAEALLRWRHPRLGTVADADLVPVAESVDLIDEIGAWLLHQSCGQLARWLDEGWDLWLGVQLSACQLAAPEIVDEVGCALHRHHVPAERLILQVTEESLGSVELTGAVTTLGALRSLGVRTALVHYGTGTTPLGWLRRLPVDLLKVDRAVFTARIPVQRETPKGEPLMGALVGLGRRLGLQVVAEGLEEESQVDLVRAAGCRYGQGQVFGRPTPAEHFEAYLETRRSATP